MRWLMLVCNMIQKKEISLKFSDWMIAGLAYRHLTILLLKMANESS